LGAWKKTRVSFWLIVAPIRLMIAGSHAIQ
jgi:hypothetical protein